MSELSYEELQEKGIFDVPYRAFEYMQHQQAKIDELQLELSTSKQVLHNVINMERAKKEELQARVDKALEAITAIDEYDHADKLEEVYKILKGNKDEN